MEELRKQCMAWLEQTNPLKGLSISRAGSIYDMARKFGSPRLQYTYNEIEKTDPVVFVCCDRRESALAGLEWSFIPRAHADETLAQEQAEALTKFTDQIDNFSETLSHLDGAFFRGYAHAQPIWDGKAVAHVNLLDSWNFLTDPDGNWYWNPACHETPSGLDTVEGAQLVSLTRRRSIDYPILFIYIRKALGERDYGRFIERHGIPHAAIIMAPGTEEKDLAKYLAAANAWNNGQDLALPNASDIKLATEARGTDPFTPFVEHQDKYTVLLATGATLTTLAQADTGSLAGGAHMEVWREIVARDGVKIAEALNRYLFRRYLELEFPGRPMAAKFVLSNEKKQTAEKVADLAGKLKTAGYLVDKEQLEEKVGMKLVKDEGSGGLGGLERLGGLMHNKQPSEPSKPAKPSKPENDDILSAFAKDMSPAGKAVEELLKNPSKEAAEALLAKLDTLLPEDPAMVAVLSEAMANEFSIDGRARTPSAPQKEELANKITNPCPKCHRQMTKEGTCTHCEKVAANKVAVDGLIAELGTKGNNGKGKGWKDRTENLGELEQSTIDDIKKANPKMNVDASVATVNIEQLQHSIKNHGNAEKEAKRGQIAITKEDLRRIPEVLADYDSIKAGKGIGEGKNQEAVVFRKNYPDGTVACVELDVFNDSMKKRTLKFQTMWKEKN